MEKNVVHFGLVDCYKVEALSAWRASAIAARNVAFPVADVLYRMPIVEYTDNADREVMEKSFSAIP